MRLGQEQTSAQYTWKQTTIMGQSKIGTAHTQISKSRQVQASLGKSRACMHVYVCMYMSAILSCLVSSYRVLCQVVLRYSISCIAFFVCRSQALRNLTYSTNLNSRSCIQGHRPFGSVAIVSPTSMPKGAL